MAATFVVLTVIGTFALSKLFGSTPEPTADTGTTPAVSSPAAPSPEAPTEPSEAQTPSVEPSPSEAAASLPDGVRRCSSSGKDAVATAWSGNRDTSCAFSKAVRRAYREAAEAGDSSTFRAYSTVTKRWYDVTCGDDPPVRCTGPTGAAVVFLTPPSSRE